MSMNLFNQGADQGFPIESDTVFGLYLGNDFRDMKGLLASSEYVYRHVHIGHTFPLRSFRFPNLRGFELPNRSELS